MAIRTKIRSRVIDFLERHLTGKSMHYTQVISIIVPLLIDQAFIIGLSLLNTAMISSSGVAAVSAVGMVDSLNIFLINVFIAVATGGTVVVAQYKGSGNDGMVSKSAAQAITTVGLLSLIIAGIIIIFHMPVINLLFGKAEADVLENAKIYLIGSCISYPFIAIVEAACGVLRGTSQAKSSLGLSLVMNVSYVVCNILFITILQWGIMGMVTSMVFSRGLAMIVSLVYFIRYNHTLNFKLRNALTFNWAIQKKILFIGLPFAAEQMFFNGGKILTQTFIVQLGTMSMAVNTISNSVTNLFQIGANAINLSAVTVIGQCMGRRDVEDAKKFVKSFLLMASITYFFAAGLLIPLFPLLIKLFSPPQEIVGTIFIIVCMTGLAQPFLWPRSFIIPASMRAAGDSKFTSLISLMTMWMFRVILGYVLGIVLPFGIVGVWAAMILEWAIRGFIFSIRFKGKKWYEHHLID